MAWLKAWMPKVYPSIKLKERSAPKNRWSLTTTGVEIAPNHTLIAKLHIFNHYIYLLLYSICSCISIKVTFIHLNHYLVVIEGLHRVEDYGLTEFLRPIICIFESNLDSFFNNN